MRIIITKEGENLIRNINYELNSNKKITGHSKLHQSKSLTRSASLVDGKHLRHTASFFNRNSNLINEISDLKMNSSTKRIDHEGKIIGVHSCKKIPVQQQKISIPKDVSIKYNSDKEIKLKSSLLPNLPNNIMKILENSIKTPRYPYENYNNNEQEFNLTIKDALRDGVIIKLKESLKSRNEIRERNFVLKETDFRTNYREVNEFNEIKKLVRLKISADQTNFINYLNRKEEISDKFIKKVCVLNENEMTKFNRVCLKVNHSEQKENLYRKIIEEKLDEKAKDIKIECARDLKKTGDWLKQFRQVSENYKLIRNQQPYIETLLQTKKKFWDKHDFDRLNKRKDNMLSMTNKSSIGDFKCKERPSNKESNIVLNI